MKKLENMSRRELRQYAKDNGITVTFGINSKAGIRAFIESAVVCPDDCDSNSEDDPVQPEPEQIDTPTPEPEDVVDIECALTGYYVVKIDANGNRVVEIKCERLNDAIRERNRLAGA